MKKRRRLSVFWIVGLVLSLILAGCSGKNEAGEGDGTGGSSSSSAAAESETDDLPRTLSISMFDRGAVSSDEGTYEENRWVDWIREQTGIHVTFVPVPRNQAQEKLNMLIASNQAPDLIWEYDRNYIAKLVSQGVIQPVDEYVEKYSTVYKQYLEEHPELKPYVTFDGKMYAITSKRNLFTIANHGMWIRQDWLDRLGLKTPETIDELIEVAQAFKQHMPDSVPIVGYTSYDIYQALHGAVYFDWYLEDGKLTYGATTDRFGEALALEEKLYDLGLVDKEYFTDKDNQRAIQLWVTGKAGICMCQWSGAKTDTMMMDLMRNDPDARPVPLESVSTKYGKYGLYQETPAFMYITFNKNMKNPKAAIEYLDWMLKEGWVTLRYGFEGVHHQVVNGVRQIIDQDKFKKEVAYADEYAILRDEEANPEELIVRAAPDELSQRYARLKVESLQTAMKNTFRRDIPYGPSFPELNEAAVSLKTRIDELRAQMVLQKGNYTAQWALEEIRKEWKRLGGEEIEKKVQEWYEQNKSSF